MSDPVKATADAVTLVMTPVRAAVTRLRDRGDDATRSEMRALDAVCLAAEVSLHDMLAAIEDGLHELAEGRE